MFIQEPLQAKCSLGKLMYMYIHQLLGIPAHCNSSFKEFYIQFKQNKQEYIVYFGNLDKEVLLRCIFQFISSVLFFWNSFEYYRDMSQELKEHQEQNMVFYMYKLFPDLLRQLIMKGKYNSKSMHQ